MENIWYCKIGGHFTGAVSDVAMRHAIMEAYVKLTGTRPEFLFSGWGQSLTESERAAVEKRPPKAEPADDALLRLAMELCEAVDAADADVGGYRPINTILAQLGPAVDRAANERLKLAGGAVS